MKLKSITLIAAFGLWTALTLGGSICGFLVIAGPNSVTRLNVIQSDSISPIAILTVFLCGGGLWGLGIARLINADATSMVTACALSWTATIFTFVMAIVFLASSLGVGFSGIRVLPYFPHSTHYNFLSIFVPVIGIISAINAYVATGTLGFKELRKSAGMYAGIAAALGFLAVGLLLLYGFGWEVGEPVPGKYGMLKLMLFCSIGGALAGGMAIGWVLEKSRIREKT
jgi:hypothetical protein